MIKKLIQSFHDFNAGNEIRKSIPKLKRESEGLRSEGLINLIYGKEWERFFWIKQLRSEIEELTRLVEKCRPKVILEIGTNMGGSLFLFSKVSDPDALIISVDLEGGPGGGGYPKFREQFYRSFADGNRSIHLIRGDSHDPQILDRVIELLNGLEVDFLFLDGDHSYKGIKQDFEMYGSLVRSGGMVGFHDIKPSPPDDWRQVKPFWDEITTSYKNQEILGKEDSWGGIGVLFK